MTKKLSAVALAGVAILSLGLTACGGGSNGGAVDNSIVIRGCTPKHELIPAHTNETCGGDMVTAMTSQLIHYNTDTTKPEMDIAESIESEDSVHFTVKLKKGYKFHDGTEVKAANFVKAWNYTAAFKNGQAGQFFFSPVKGYDEVAAEGSTKDEMEGLKVVDDYTFTIETSAPTSNLVIRLGYSTFSPLPDSFFQDPKAFAENPIGAGPFKFVSKSTEEYVFEKFADYSGANPAQVDKLTFRVYTDDSAAYNDVVSNNLDYTNSIPSDFLVDDQYKKQLPDRNLQKETGRINGIVFSPNDEQLKNNLDLRRAISMAVDRATIAKQIFNGSQTSADGWAPKIIDGATDDACGDNCKFNPEEAKALYAKAGGYNGTLTMTVNGDGGHKPWAEAVCNSIKNTLGLECVVTPTPDFSTMQKMIDAHELKGLFRTGWQMDYPSIENFLAPIYGKGADSNWSDYDNPKFDAKLMEATAAKTLDEANKLYHEAELMLGHDLPVMPVWYPLTTVGWSDRVENVKINVFGVIDFSAVSVKK